MLPQKPMLAYSKSPDPATLAYPVMFQPKLDGIRALVHGGKVYSRTLKLIPNASIQAALGRPEYEGFDGELVVGDPRDPACYRTTSSFVMADSKVGEPWTFFVFDLHNHPGDNLHRYNALRDWMKGNVHDDRVQLVATAMVQDAEALEAMEAAVLADGYEGGIIRMPNAAYKHGRAGKAGPLLKLKRYVDFEARVVGVYEEMHNANVAMTNALGRTERSTAKAGLVGKGTLGGLVLVAINGPAEGCEFRCGTGFDAAMRRDLWVEAKERNPDRTVPTMHAAGNLQGRIAKVKSFPIGVKDKPRHPVFLGWRDMEIDG